VASGRAYADKMDEVVHRVASAAGDVTHPLLDVRPLHRACVVLIGADQGLCGSYNVSINRRGKELIDELVGNGTACVVVTVGRKARAFLRHRGIVPDYHFSQITAKSDVSEPLAISRQIRSLYTEPRVDQVQVVYSRFVSTLRHVPTVADLLPVRRMARRGEGTAAGPTEYIFEPAPERLFAALLPRYVDTRIYHLLLEAAASEQAARMTAMASATDNAEELIKHLTLQRNRARQEAITSELMDVVGGAEALKEPK
jgi:F-type H+-transporting ATPase subunit gamma